MPTLGERLEVVSGNSAARLKPEILQTMERHLGSSTSAR